MPLNAEARRPTNGMIVRSRIVLPVGSDIVRLGHRFVKGVSCTNIEVLSGSWWMTLATAEELIARGGAANTSISDIFRLAGAIARRFGGSGDLLAVCRTAEPLICFVGPGTVQDFRGDASVDETGRMLPDADPPLWVPYPWVMQLHLTLTRKSSGVGSSRITIARQAFSRAHVLPLDEWDDDFLNRPPDRWRVI